MFGVSRRSLNVLYAVASGFYKGPCSKTHGATKKRGACATFAGGLLGASLGQLGAKNGAQEETQYVMECALAPVK